MELLGQEHVVFWRHQTLNTRRLDQLEIAGPGIRVAIDNIDDKLNVRYMGEVLVRTRAAWMK